MAVNVTIYAHKFVFASTTWDASAGGAIQVEIEKRATAIKEHLSDLFPKYVEMVDGEMNVQVTLRDLSVEVHVGDEGTGTAYVKNKNGEQAIGLGTLIVESVRRNQGRASPGTIAIGFTHESSDGGDPED